MDREVKIRSGNTVRKIPSEKYISAQYKSENIDPKNRNRKVQIGTYTSNK